LRVIGKWKGKGEELFQGGKGIRSNQNKDWANPEVDGLDLMGGEVNGKVPKGRILLGRGAEAQNYRRFLGQDEKVSLWGDYMVDR